MQRTAIITGITGQDGSYLADLLLGKGYKVYGLKRRSSDNDLGCSRHLAGVPGFEVVEGDLGDLSSLCRLTSLVRADEFYNLGAQSHVGTSFGQPIYTLESSGEGVLNCLEAIRMSGIHTRFYQASTSEMFGGMSGEMRMSEASAFHPRSPYGCAKMYGYWITVNYREAYKMFACNGILFNHESERRGPNFVTRKITLAVAAIARGRQDVVRLGNLDAKRDWGHAEDYVYGMWQMLNHAYPMDFVLATGETHTVREFCEIAFAHAGLGDYAKYVVVDPAFYRPAEVDVLIGDSSLARHTLGWQPKVSFEQLVARMVDADMKLLEVAA